MIKSPLSGWLGGKWQLSRQIVPLIPEHECYVEPFAGAARLQVSFPFPWNRSRYGHSDSLIPFFAASIPFLYAPSIGLLMRYLPSYAISV